MRLARKGKSKGSESSWARERQAQVTSVNLDFKVTSKKDSLLAITDSKAQIHLGLHVVGIYYAHILAWHLPTYWDDRNTAVYHGVIIQHQSQQSEEKKARVYSTWRNNDWPCAEDLQSDSAENTLPNTTAFTFTKPMMIPDYHKTVMLTWGWHH